MNLQAWEGVLHKLQKCMEQSQHTEFINNNNNVSNSDGVGITSRSDHNSEYSQFPVEPQSGGGAGVGWRQPSPPPQSLHRMGEEDPDDEEMEVDPQEDDVELSRKRKELREIEERIIHKKASIVMKTMGVFANDKTLQERNGPAASGGGDPLRERVMRILQERHSAAFFSKLQSPKERLKSSHPNGDQHPLRLRVTAALERRCTEPRGSPAHSHEVAEVSPLPPTQLVPPSASQDNNNNIDRGFERFLSVLNKGVDINFLSRIVTDDTGDPPSGADVLSAGRHSEESESRRSNSSASLPGCHSWEVEAESGRGREKASLPHAEEVEDRRGGRSLGSSSHSKSPVVERKKEEEEEEKDEEEEPKKVEDPQQQQLQNILKTLGLNLEVDDLSKVADRTRERLYGKKTERQGVPERRKRRFHREDSHSSSSSSSRSSSSSSRSSSRSPSRDRRFHSGDSEQRREPEGVTHGSMDVHLHNGSQDVFDYELQYPESETHHQAGPSQAGPSQAGPSQTALPDYSAPSQYDTAYAHWMQVQNSTFSLHSFDQNSYPQEGVGVPVGFPQPWCTRHEYLKDLVLSTNPNLAESEGQKGSVYNEHCLKFIQTKERPVTSQMTPEMSQEKVAATNVHIRQAAYNHRWHATWQYHYQSCSQNPQKFLEQLRRRINQCKKNTYNDPLMHADTRRMQAVYNSWRQVADQYKSTSGPQRPNLEIVHVNKKKRKKRKKRHWQQMLAAPSRSLRRLKEKSIPQFKQVSVNITVTPQEQEAEPHKKEPHAHSEPPRVERRVLTEEEIKANLRKKLEAFNQKAKSGAVRPCTSATQPDRPQTSMLE